MFIEELVGSVHLEDHECEYKAKLDRSNTLGWLKTIAGFGNASGGTFYIGVEDKSHKLIGFDRESVDAERNFFNNQMNEHIAPRPLYKITFLRYEIREQERFVLKVDVSESPVKPIIVKYNGVPSIYIRREGFTNGATYEEIITMSIRSQSSAYDTLMSDCLYNRNDYRALLTFHKKHTGGQELTDKALASLGFYNEKNYLTNGAVLFKDDYNGHKNDIQCSVFAGLTRGSERIVTVNKFSGNITDAIEYAYSFVLQRMNHSLIKKADAHVDVDAFPRRALFEGIINAFAHRDYFLDGTQIQIDLFRDRLEISSPGSFFHGEPIRKTYDLSGIISKRRNELICGVLVHCDVMEAAGTGFDKIVEDYSDADEKHKPYICSASDHFTLVLPDLTYAAGVTDTSLPGLEFVPVPGGSNHDEQILSFCYHSARTAAAIAEHLKISNSTHLRKNILGKLIQSRYLTAEKVSRTMYYKTNQEKVRVV